MSFWRSSTMSSSELTIDAAEQAAAIAVASPHPLHKATIEGRTSPPSARRREAANGDRRTTAVSSACCCGMRAAVVVRVLLAIVLLLLLCASIIWFDRMKVLFIATLTYVHELGPLRGSVVLCVANIVGAMLLLPCVPFTLGAGFLYGTLVGSAIVSVASTIAAVFAFLAARYLARTSIERSLASHAKFRILDSAIHSDGFRIVLLIRSSPLHPYGVFNWLFGLTSITLRDYTVASFLGMLPATVMEVWFGTAIKNVADILSGGAHNSVASRVIFWAGLAISVVATALLTVLLKRKLRAELDKYESVATSETDAPDDDEFGLDEVESGLAPDSDSTPLPLSLRMPAIEMAEIHHSALRVDQHEAALGGDSFHRDAGATSRRNSDVRKLMTTEPARATSAANGTSGSATAATSTRATRTKSNSSSGGGGCGADSSGGAGAPHVHLSNGSPMGIAAAQRSPVPLLPPPSEGGGLHAPRSSPIRADAELQLSTPRSPSHSSPVSSLQDEESAESDHLIDTNNNV